MPHIASEQAPRFGLESLQVTGLASPSRGAKETSVWRLTLKPGAPGVPHSVNREEIFVALAGSAVLTVNDQPTELRAGDAFIVPAGQLFSLSNPGSEPFEALAALPVGGETQFPGGAPFLPPW